MLAVGPDANYALKFAHPEGDPWGVFAMLWRCLGLEMRDHYGEWAWRTPGWWPYWPTSPSARRAREIRRGETAL